MAEIVRNLSFKEYQSRDGLSNSMLSKIAISPLHFKESQNNPVEKTDALIFGSLLHCLVLEPENFNRDFAIEPIVNKRTNEGKEILVQFYLENAEKTIVNEEQLKLANILKDKIMEHEIARKLLIGKGETEVSLFWEDEETGIKCKGRPDKLFKKIIVDLKTSRSAKPEEFMKHAYEFNYHKQAYWYSWGYEQCFKEEPKGFVFIAVEKEKPYAVAVYEVTELFKEIGKIEARQNLLTYKDCADKGKWWGYDGEKPIIHDLDPPDWVLKKYLDKLDLDLGEES
jgi:exodeoxyribonuclease VIII